MNISLDKTSDVSGVLTLTIEANDYAPEVDKKLKAFCKQAQMPGFRKGHVPMGMAKKIYGPKAKADAVDDVISKSINDYIQEQKIRLLGHPLAHEGQEPQDLELQETFEFKFDLAIAPEIKVELTSKDKVPYYDIKVDDAQVNSRLNVLTRQAGHSEPADEYADGDILRGVLAELDEDGKPKEGGIQVERASLMPNYFRDDDQKKLFEKVKKNTVLTFNPSKAYSDSDAELAALLKIDRDAVGEHKGDFSFQVDDINRFVPATLDQDFYDRIFGKDTVKSEDECRARIKEEISRQYEADSDYKFLLDVRALAEEKAKDMQMPSELLARILKERRSENAPEISDKDIEESIKYLRWDLIRNKLANDNQVKVEDKDLHALAIEAARYQFAQYGMNDIPQEYLEQFAQNTLKNEEQVQQLINRSVDQKLTQALKGKLNLQHKSISVEEFNKLFEEK